MTKARQRPPRSLTEITRNQFFDVQFWNDDWEEVEVEYSQGLAQWEASALVEAFMRHRCHCWHAQTELISMFWRATSCTIGEHVG